MNEYQVCIIAGGFIAAFVTVLYILCWIGQWAWAWIDDSEMDKTNSLNKLIMTKVLGFSYRKDISTIRPYMKFTNKEDFDNCGYFNKDRYVEERAEGWIAFFMLVSMSAIPMVVMLSIKFIYVSIPLASLLLIAHLARFARRHKKLFDKHVKDKDAHKES